MSSPVVLGAVARRHWQVVPHIEQVSGCQEILRAGRVGERVAWCGVEWGTEPFGCVGVVGPIHFLPWRLP